MQQAIADKVDVIFTLGGTGVGQRDITPETVASLCDKIIPGIMENIRLKFGAEKPVALLSRGIAGMTGTTQIYTLPGSVLAQGCLEPADLLHGTGVASLFILHGGDLAVELVLAQLELLQTSRELGLGAAEGAVIGMLVASICGSAFALDAYRRERRTETSALPTLVAAFKSRSIPARRAPREGGQVGRLPERQRSRA